MCLQNPPRPRTDTYFGVPQCRNSLLWNSSSSIPKTPLRHWIRTPQLVASLPPYVAFVVEKEVKGIKVENHRTRFLPVLICRCRKLSLRKAGSVKAKSLLKGPSTFSGCRPIAALTLAVWQYTRRCSSWGCLVGAATVRQVTLPHSSLTLLSRYFKERLIKTVVLWAKLAFCDHFLIISFVFDLAVGLWNEVPLDLPGFVFYLSVNISAPSLVTWSGIKEIYPFLKEKKKKSLREGMIIGKMGFILYWMAIFWQSKSSPELKLCLLSKQNVSPCVVCLILQQKGETTLKQPRVLGKGWDSITVLQALKRNLCASFGAIFGLLVKNPVFYNLLWV